MTKGIPPHRIIIAFAVLPFTVLVAIPAMLHVSLPTSYTQSLFRGWLSIISSGLFIFSGLVLLYSTNFLFLRHGEGTLAPWHPPERLIVMGPYRYLRQPMMMSVFCILFGEVLFLASWASLTWFCVFVAANLMYIPLVEERALLQRFGKDYQNYRKNVPGWLPRITPWDGP